MDVFQQIRHLDDTPVEGRLHVVRVYEQPMDVVDADGADVMDLANLREASLHLVRYSPRGGVVPL